MHRKLMISMSCALVCVARNQISANSTGQCSSWMWKSQSSAEAHQDKTHIKPKLSHSNVWGAKEMLYESAFIITTITNPVRWAWKKIDCYSKAPHLVDRFFRHQLSLAILPSNFHRNIFCILLLFLRRLHQLSSFFPLPFLCTTFLESFPSISHLPPLPLLGSFYPFQWSNIIILFFYIYHITINLWRQVIIHIFYFTLYGPSILMRAVCIHFRIQCRQSTELLALHG